MKTRNNIQKTALAAIAATGLAICSLTINAQLSKNNLFFDDGHNHFVMAMNTANYNSGASLTRTRDFNSANAFAAYLTEETEEPLQLENWMMNDFGFPMMGLIEAETESPMEIEDWMTEDSKFDVYAFILEVETEETMEVENWMLNENNFNGSGVNKVVGEPKESNPVISTGKYIFSETNYESQLKIEDWMVNPNIWKN